MSPLGSVGRRCLTAWAQSATASLQPYCLPCVARLPSLGCSPWVVTWTLDSGLLCTTSSQQNASERLFQRSLLNKVWPCSLVTILPLIPRGHRHSKWKDGAADRAHLPHGTWNPLCPVQLSQLHPPCLVSFGGHPHRGCEAGLYICESHLWAGSAHWSSSVNIS